jgi:hypothetical protein
MEGRDELGGDDDSDRVVVEVCISAHIGQSIARLDRVVVVTSR